MAATDHVRTFSFQDLDGTGITLENAVYQALGAASVCWEHISQSGVFDDEFANVVGEALLEFIRERFAELLADGTPEFVGTASALRDALYERTVPLAGRVALYRIP